MIGLWQTRQAGWTRTGEKRRTLKRSQFIKNKRKKYKEDDFLSGFLEGKPFDSTIYDILYGWQFSKKPWKKAAARKRRTEEKRIIPFLDELSDKPKSKKIEDGFSLYFKRYWE